MPSGQGPFKGTTTCPYCGVGCAVQGTVVGGRLLGVNAPDGVAPNNGLICQKGAWLDRVHSSRDGRALYPMVRRTRTEPLRRVGWDEATQFVAAKLADARAVHGPQSLAWYGSGQLDTEASYLFTKLFKGSLGCNNTDTNSRLCMSSAVAAYIKAFGADAPPTCYDDLDEAEVYLILGANMAANHPVLFQRITARRGKVAGTRIICVDPRRTRTAELSDIHVPVAPGGDAAFLLLVARRLIQSTRFDNRFIRRHTEGFDQFWGQVMAADESDLLDRCGVHPGRVDEVAEYLASTRKIISLYCQGANQSSFGVDKNLALINLHLLRGAVGIAGAGPFSLTGQPNAMGGREVGYLSHQLPGYRVVTNPEHRQEMESQWCLANGAIDPNPGLSTLPMFEAGAGGKIQALWVAATNPAASVPDSDMVRKALGTIPFVVCQDAYGRTETTEFADVILPACQWGEKSGTMTNSERLVRRSARLIAPPGEALPDWQIVRDVALAMGVNGFDFESVESVWNEYIATTAGTDCDQSGMTNERLQDGPLHWPCPSPRHPGTQRRYLSGRFSTPSGRARFHTVRVGLAAEHPDESFPYVLTTGRIATQWHTRTRTGRIAELVSQEPEPFVELHPDDAEKLGVVDGERIQICSERGRAILRARVTTGVRPGLVFVPFHWADLYHSAANINYVASRRLDPLSGQPELKYTAVSIRAVRASAVGVPATDLDPLPDRSRDADVASASRSVAVGGS